MFPTPDQGLFRFFLWQEYVSVWVSVSVVAAPAGVNDFV